MFPPLKELIENPLGVFKAVRRFFEKSVDHEIEKSSLREKKGSVKEEKREREDSIGVRIKTGKFIRAEE